MKSQRQQPLLVVLHPHLRPDVEKDTRGIDIGSVLENADAAGLFEHEEPIVTGMGEQDGTSEGQAAKGSLEVQERNRIRLVGIVDRPRSRRRRHRGRSRIRLARGARAGRNQNSNKGKAPLHGRVW